MMNQVEIQKEEKSLWHNKDYLLLWSGQAISAFGSSASHIVLPLLILDLTHSPAQAGIVGAFTTIPYVLFSLFIGPFIDRVNRKKIMIFCDIGRTIAFGSVAIALFLHHISIVHLYLAALLYGICFVFFDITEVSSIRKLVGKEQVAAATSQNSATDGIAAFLGPSIGAALYQIGKAIPFLIDTLSYVISVISLLLIKTKFQEERTVVEKVDIKKDLKEGISWLFHNKIVRDMAIINAGVSFVFADLYLILIVLAKEQKATALQIGTIVSIAAVGSILGSIIGAHIQKKFHTGHLIIIANWIQAFLWLVYILAPNFIVIGIITAVISFINSVWAIAQISYRVSLIPDELQGRVNSVFRFLVYSAIPLGMVITGFALQAFGAKATIMMFFFVLVVFSIVATFSRDLRGKTEINKNVATAS